MTDHLSSAAATTGARGGSLQGLTKAQVLCPLCGMQIEANPSNMCADCLRHQVDLSTEIHPQGQLVQCKRCFKWQTKSKHWIAAELESRELLAIVLKFLNGLQRVQVIEAGWIWTEPHSKRLKVKLNARKEVLNGVQVQQRVEIEFVVRTIQCDACNLSFTEQTWKAMIQVRQRVEHKRTFFFLEQLLLARKMQDQILDIQLAKDGMDLYFADKNAAQQFAAFLGAVVPVRSKISRKLVSEDRQNNIHRNQHTLVVEVVPLCKDDLILLTSKAWGGSIQGLCIVSRITSVIHLLDPTTLTHMEVPAAKYWRTPLDAIMTSKDLVQFEVLDIEEIRDTQTKKAALSSSSASASYADQKRWKLTEVEVVKTSDFGVNDISYRVVTHLGHLLQVGDSVMGYDVKNATSLGGRKEELRGLRYDPPDIVLVKKVEVEKGGKKERRRLKRLAKRRGGGEKRSYGGGGGGGGGRGGSAASSVVGEEDVEFLDFAAELEQDEEMRDFLAQHEAEMMRKGKGGNGEEERGEEEEEEGDVDGVKGREEGVDEEDVG